LRIRDKHPGSATLEYFAVFVLEKLTFPLSIKKSFWIRIPDPDSPKSLDMDPDLIKWI